MRTTEEARASRPAPCHGGEDLSELSLAHAVGLAHGGGLAEGLAIQRQQVEALKDPASAPALACLARQLPLLDALFQRMAEDAVAERVPGRRGELLRGALQAQQAYARTFALVRALAPQAPTLVEARTVTGDSSYSDRGAPEVVLVASVAGADAGGGVEAAAGPGTGWVAP